MHQPHPLASDAGYGFAAYRLGRAYYRGELGFILLSEAVRCMERAYALGDYHGAHDLAQWYESGEKLERNYGQALDLYRKASDLGDPFSSLRLQMAYTLGELGLKRDLVQARQYELLFSQQTAASVI